MRLLAIDAATSVFSVALGTEQDVWYFEADAGPRHSELALDCAGVLMRKAGLMPVDLSGVACMGGPGSFTGLRIGFSLAKGLALSLGIPFVPVPTLDCMAYPFAAWPGLVVPVIDAKKNAFFCALYRDGRRISAEMDAGPEEIAAAVAAVGRETRRPDEPLNVLLTGPDADKLLRRLPSEYGRNQRLNIAGPAPEARRGYGRVLLELSRRDIAQKDQIFNNDDMDYFSGPLYIRKSDAELNAR
ncbi:MAG: tRNA (adenosine(37)-N6)-threonylcarbamoyltransferase complex dimerization subunit type 1 TsaB [Treponema sp.]|nr:tRNA (adenosine(37)-N6)-threonylcarbamoyltransferase complex dimerization subunit type 1 TsaB [Treponema sp.]